MNLVKLLQELDGKSLGKDDDGDAVFAKLLPALSKAELKQLEALIPCPIPAHISELLCLTRGIEPAFNEIDFSGLSLDYAFEMKDLLPHGLPIAADGFGNFWVIDLLPKSTDWGPIYYVCHDPPVIVYQAKTFEEFVQQTISFASFEKESLINHVHDTCTAQIWKDNPNTIMPEDAMHPGDPDLGLFVQSLEKGYLFIDLRRARIGDGFSWGRYGPKTEVVRNGYQSIFAIKKEVGFFEKLFRRK